MATAKSNKLNTFRKTIYHTLNTSKKISRIEIYCERLKLCGHPTTGFLSARVIAGI